MSVLNPVITIKLDAKWRERSGDSALNHVDGPITSLVRRSSLEDVFLRLTGRSLIE